jgi:hypothetical protein
MKRALALFLAGASVPLLGVVPMLTGAGELPPNIDNQPTRRAAVLLVVEFVPPHNWDMAQYKAIYSDYRDCLVEAEKLNHTREQFVEPPVENNRVAMCFVSYLPQ